MNLPSQGGVSQFPGGMTFPGPQVQSWVGAQPVDGNTFAQFNPLIMENFNGGDIFPVVSSQMLHANFSVFPGMKYYLGSEFSVLRDAEILLHFGRMVKTLKTYRTYLDCGPFGSAIDPSKILILLSGLSICLI